MKLQLTVIVLFLFTSIRGTPYRNGVRIRWKPLGSPTHPLPLPPQPQPPTPILSIQPQTPIVNVHPESGDPEGRIIGGYHATTGQIYYQLRVSTYKNGKYGFCGGALVKYHSVQFGITAAHCVWDATQPKNTVMASDVRIIAGEIDTKSFSRNEQYRDMERVVIYPTFNNDDPDHSDDIALLFWKEPLTLNRHANIIPLPPAIWPDPARVVISGWGSTNPDTLANGTGATIPSVLQVLTIRTWDNKVCRSYAALDVDVTWKQMCVHQAGKDLGVCLGDSGGPAAGYDKKTRKFHLAGVLSYYLDKCGSRSFPAVYTKVGAYLSWIWSEVDIYSYVSFGNDNEITKK
ncbi:unnamed protein product [Orchesella dallaii]|uniref:Peptidase S1 domain-containing protein n=1 Tax=Orchesella dallaii TaxID=48710 RepID=A0ABP1Q1L7_9HEXA